MGVLARNNEKIYFRENVVVTKNLPPYFPISLVRNQIQFFFFFLLVFFYNGSKTVLIRFFRYFGINLVHFRNNSQKLPYSVWSLKCLFKCQETHMSCMYIAGTFLRVAHFGLRHGKEPTSSTTVVV